MDDAGTSEEIARSVPAGEPLPSPPGVPAKRWAGMLVHGMAALPPMGA